MPARGSGQGGASRSNSGAARPIREEFAWYSRKDFKNEHRVHTIFPKYRTDVCDSLGKPGRQLERLLGPRWREPCGPVSERAGASGEENTEIDCTAEPSAIARRDGTADRAVSAARAAVPSRRACRLGEGSALRRRWPDRASRDGLRRGRANRGRVDPAAGTGTKALRKRGQAPRTARPASPQDANHVRFVCEPCPACTRPSHFLKARDAQRS